MATLTPTEIDPQDFTGDALQRSYTILTNEATGDFYFDFVEYPEDFDMNTLKFYRVEGKSIPEVEAAFRSIFFGETATADNTASAGNETTTASSSSASLSGSLSGLRTAAGLASGETAQNPLALSSPKKADGNRGVCDLERLYLNSKT